MIGRAVSASALAGVLVIGLAGPADAARWRVYSDYRGETFLVMKKTERRLLMGSVGPDWDCFKGRKRGNRYRGRLKTVVDPLRGWVKVRRIRAGFETPPGVLVISNYGYGVQRTGWVNSRARTMRAVTGVSIRKVVRWCAA